MAVTHRDYSAEQVEAARSVLLEPVRLLGECRDNLVEVGGRVPQFLPPRQPSQFHRTVSVRGERKPDLVSVRMDVYQPSTTDGRVVLRLNHWGQGSR